MMIRIGNFLFHWRNTLFPVGYLLLLIPSARVFENIYMAAGLGLGVALLGQSIRAVTIGFDYIKRGGKDRQVYADRLVVGGVFAHCRNPLYDGNFLIIVGFAIASNSVVFLACAIPLYAFAYAAIIAAEENYLRTKFGQEFEDYCARVNRLLPSLGGFSKSIEGMRFNWRRLITAEYGSTFMWSSGIVLITMKNLWVAGGAAEHQPAIRMLEIFLVCVIGAYAVARYLKKSGKLKLKTGG